MNIYYSASMRGPAGDAATDEQLDANNERALRRAGLLARGLRDPCPLYVPHRHEPAMRPGWRAGLVAAEAFLLMDRDIITLCGLVICDSNPKESAGVRTELGYAEEFSVPVFHSWTFEDDYLTGVGAMLARSVRRGRLPRWVLELTRVGD